MIDVPVDVRNLTLRQVNNNARCDDPAELLSSAKRILLYTIFFSARGHTIMAYKKGESGNPSGRPKGTVNTHAVQAARKAAEEYNILPLDFFLTQLNDKTKGLAWRLDNAKAAAPYVHRKMPIGIDDGNGGPIAFATPEQLSMLSASDLKKLEEVMQKLAAITTPGLMVSAGVAAALASTEED